ncbi:MAG: glycosyltransferase family 2 protein, partial [Actinobacteria bacterium]|nr:glycosyltransferase family 2 protein [Actinomycetota bacterium]
MVIISSFYNEEYLLPWWLEHHKKIFEHGVLFDYFSTDNSTKIIKKICPTWEVRPTRNKDWDFPANDREYMDAEREFQGYKIVLVTTEFLVGKLPKLGKSPTAYSIPFVRLVDDNPEKLPTYDKPLTAQKHSAYKDKNDWNKRRFLHNYPDGQYDIGRHSTALKTTNIPMLIYKYVYSPWTEEFIKRKLQMKDHVNPENIKRGWGLHHF